MLLYNMYYIQSISYKGFISEKSIQHKCYFLKLRSSVWCVWSFWWSHISLYHKSIHFLHENAFFLLIVSQILKFVIVFNEDGYFCNWTALRNIILQFQLKLLIRTFWVRSLHIAIFHFWILISHIRVNHKPRGQIFGYFWPLLPPSWSLLVNKTYVIKWSFC